MNFFPTPVHLGIFVFLAGLFLACLGILIKTTKFSKWMTDQTNYQFKIFGFEGEIRATARVEKNIKIWAVVMIAMSVYFTYFLFLDAKNIDDFKKSHVCGDLDHNH